jgi:hypothetical protein
LSSPRFSTLYRRGRHIKFTASENGNASAASTAIPPSAHTFSRVSKKPKPTLARLADQDYESGGDGSFEVIATGESPRDIVRTRDAEARAAEKQSPHEGRGA